MYPKTSHRLRDRPIPIDTRSPETSNFTLYRLPIESGLSPIQNRRARKRFVSIGVSVSCEPICPRSTKIGSAERNSNRFSGGRRILDRAHSIVRSKPHWNFCYWAKKRCNRLLGGSRLYSAGDNPALVKSIDVLNRKPQGTVGLRAGSEEAGRVHA